MKSFYQTGGKKGPFTLRDNTYRRMWYLIADYEYFREAQEGLIEFDKFKEERHSVTEDEVMNKCNFDHYIEAIEKAQKQIPEIYVEDVMNHIAHKTKYADINYVHENTLKKWVQRFIFHVAKNLGEI